MEVPVGCPVIFNDGILGKYDGRHLKCSVVEGEVSKLIMAAKTTICGTRAGLKRVIMLSCGNEDITRRGHGISNDSWLRSSQPNMAKIIMDQIESFNKEVVEAGGRLMVTSPIPRPIEVHPGISNNSLRLQRFLSGVFVQLSDDVHRFNDRNRVKTANIKAVVEVKNTTRRNKEFKKDRIYYEWEDKVNRRQQHMIKTASFERDFIHIREKRMNMLKLARKYLSEENRKLTQKVLRV